MSVPTQRCSSTWVLSRRVPTASQQHRPPPADIRSLTIERLKQRAPQSLDGRRTARAESMASDYLHPAASEKLDDEMADLIAKVEAAWNAYVRAKNPQQKG
ncbi:hypothetical protein CVIRNUC_010523 [Coccomyxa viridis]|uniref:Uncharacterized protein n=1 Tax=Coccomyxa viridis TaxID=1274662 RepID=A0AAV1IM30_9CHLO|nr:hypothetical protein CVIRNUC_010523 [Coccomyxa viridis]